MIKQTLKKISPKKKITCTNCNTRFQFPVKPGKTLKVTCPSCKSIYEVSFVNPLVELIKGNLKWKTMSGIDKRNLVVAIMTLAMALGLILSSLSSPIKPNYEQTKTENSYAI